jgi:hypothetical protein
MSTLTYHTLSHAHARSLSCFLSHANTHLHTRTHAHARYLSHTRQPSAAMQEAATARAEGAGGSKKSSGWRRLLIVFGVRLARVLSTSGACVEYVERPASSVIFCLFLPYLFFVELVLPPAPLSLLHPLLPLLSLSLSRSLPPSLPPSLTLALESARSLARALSLPLPPTPPLVLSLPSPFLPPSDARP